MADPAAPPVGLKAADRRRRSPARLLTPAEMGQCDLASLEAGVSGVDLMTAAGNGVAEAVTARWSRRPIRVLCGPGNNGGDGFVAARRLLAAGWPTRLSLLGSIDQLKGDAAHHASLWQGVVDPFDPGLMLESELIIDAIFGAGLSRPVDGAARTMIEALIARRPPICAVDVPSGLDGATGQVRGVAAPADLTVTFFRKKPGHLLYPGRRFCGDVVLIDIGSPEVVLDAIPGATFENGPALWRDAYPWPKTEDHKYSRGHALILGGEVITGAGRLTARGAMRSGAGLVTLAAPQRAWSIYATSMIGALVHAIDGLEDFKALLSDIRRNAVAIGPGAGVGEATRAAALAALATGRAVVLDADALTSFADDPTELFAASNGRCVLTPHDGEFARLFDASGDKLTRTRRAAAVSGAVVLLKGPDTVIAAPDGRAAINTNAPADLATGGSGDVLTGFVLGLLAQGMEPFDAACAATWLHGECAAAFGSGLVAEDLPEALPGVLARLKAGPFDDDRQTGSGTPPCTP
ncbi:NAD(P)H-hydrate dehydratase [Brevundimonas sp. SL130]|uniref:NAD(P)H-hydrate dehydratase n=1 Tax=Brevundimonas sp. SL130 TaxID=2995143 RepID=UPI00226C9CEC|nr:NAD(P)H-hydrate dehydratase [Brevundimonas sp. SL130]WAC59080.1 NAD(P)H-hydrate dehydratase [Brevundimonas sp. SL130]